MPAAASPNPTEPMPPPTSMDDPVTVKMLAGGHVSGVGQAVHGRAQYLTPTTACPQGPAALSGGLRRCGRPDDGRPSTTYRKGIRTVAFGGRRRRFGFSLAVATI